MDLAFKQIVHTECCKIIEEKINVLMSELASAKEAASDASKSSVGDKHETGKAMAQLTQENLSKQMEQLSKLQFTTANLNPKKMHKKAGLGALVKSNEILFYIGPSLGQLTLNDKLLYAVSEFSPIGQSLKGKRIGDHFLLNGKESKILDLV